MKKSRWIVVANSSVARIFRIENSSTLQEVDTLLHSESRMHTSELYSDRLGRTNDRVGVNRSAMEPVTDPKKVEATFFAREISHLLNDLANKNEVDCFYLAANPSFLGVIRQSLSDHLKSLIKSDLDKDITHLTPSEIIKYFIH